MEHLNTGERVAASGERDRQAVSRNIDTRSPYPARRNPLAT
jgi:hypothetical protein